MRDGTSNLSLHRICAPLIVLGLMAGMFMLLASGFVNTRPPSKEADELQTIYEAIVGDSKGTTFGYLGDVGDYPETLSDLISPSPVPPGWNGPYLRTAQIKYGVVHDQFGSEVEYFRTVPLSVPASARGQLALISKGADRSSTNTSSTPNQSSTFTGTLPSSPSYRAASSNADNIVYPNAARNPGLVDYESLGQMSFNITNLDETAPENGFVTGCPGLYDIVISSVPRGTTEAYIAYNPGAAVVDLVQGQYLVKVFVSGSRFAVWQEQLTVKPGSALSRDLNLPGVNSHLFEPITLTLTNGSGAGLTVQQNGTEVGRSIKNGTTVTRTLDRCARIEVTNNSTKSAVDAFTMPYGNLTRRYRSAPAVLNLTVANEGPWKTLAI